MRFFVPLLAVAGLFLAACEPTGPSANQAGIYKIRASDTDEVQLRMLDSVNSLRQARGVAPVRLNAQLTAAATAHARDMSRQARAWPFGSDGSSPYDRVRRAGYSGQLVSEVYSQSFESELDTLSAWVQSGAWGEEILDPEATEMGFGWKQDASGLIWWDAVLGKGGVAGTGV